MPAFNAAAFIGRAIASVQSQSWQNWELLVVDDGSTDQTAAIVGSFVQKDRRISLFRQTNKRQGKARNTAIQYSKGDLLAFLDADDYWKPDRLEIQWQALCSTGADAVFSDAEIWEGTTCHGVLGAHRGWLQLPAALDEMLLYNRIPILTVLVKKEPLLNAGGFSELPALQNAEDYHLWCGMLLKGSRFFGLDATLAVYQRHAASATYQEDKVFWPACHALYELSQATGELQEKIRQALRQKLKNWLLHQKQPSAHRIQECFGLYFASQDRKVPAVLKLTLPGNIGIRAFHKWYA